MSYSFVLTFVPVEPGSEIQSKQARTKIYQSWIRAHEPFFEENSVPGDEQSSGGLNNIDGAKIGSGLNGVIIGAPEPFPADELEKAFASEETYYAFEIDLLSKNMLPAREYDGKNQPMALDLDAVITPKGEWIWLKGESAPTTASEAWFDRLHAIEDAGREADEAGQERLRLDWIAHLATHPAEARLAELIANFPDTVLVVGSVHF